VCLKSSQRLIKLPLTAKAFPLTLLQFETEIYFTKLLGVDLIRQFIKNTAITQRGTNFLVLSLNFLDLDVNTDQASSTRLMLLIEKIYIYILLRTRSLSHNLPYRHPSDPIFCLHISNSFAL